MLYPKVVFTSKDPSKVIGIDESEIVSCEKRYVMEVRNSGILKGRGHYLDSRYDWIIVKDDQEQLVLLALEKSRDKGGD